MPDEKRPDKLPPQIPTISLPAFEPLRLFNDEISRSMQRLDAALAGLNARIQANAERIQTAFDGITKSWRPILDGFRRYSEAKKPLKAAGVLPHRSTPWGRFDPDAPEAFPDVVLEYYAAEWEEAEAIFLADIDDYSIDTNAKAAFRDAVGCHRHGFFRSAVLTLLPAAEMEFRRLFEITPRGNAASLEELRKLVMDLPAGVILGHVAPIDLFTVLDEHLYDQVKTPEAVERFRKDPIPNRHAAIHGLVHYASAKSSLNMLILADYIFFLLSQLSRYKAELAEPET